jgi:hypothetical protein
MRKREREKERKRNIRRRSLTDLEKSLHGEGKQRNFKLTQSFSEDGSNVIVTAEIRTRGGSPSSKKGECYKKAHKNKQDPRDTAEAIYT